MRRVEAARFAFLLGIPVIAGAGLRSVARAVSDGSGITATTVVGMVVAAITGYWAIAFLLRVIAKAGLAPFGVYCIAVGAVALVAL